LKDSQLIDRIRSHTAKIAIIGQGYVGLPLAMEFASVGFKVVGLETDLERVGALAVGRSFIPDVDSARLQELIRLDRYAVTADAAVLAQCDAIVICVPTPLGKSKDPDISFVMAAAEEVAKHLRAGQLVVLESTTYPGTTEEVLLPLFESRGLQVGSDFYLAFSPERIDPGNRKFRVRDIPKVVGGVTRACTTMTAELYGSIVSQVTEVSAPRVAELAKLYENVFRNINIALANEFALMCGRLGVSTREVIDAAATKPFGFLPFYPGPGIGGHCIGIDPIYLAWKMRLSGFDSRFIQLADEINRSMPAHTVDMVVEALNRRRKCLNGSIILALGVAYKRGVGDTRESPALEVIARLREGGADVAFADPHVSSVTIDGTTMKAVEPTEDEVAKADCVLILTDHPEFDYRRIVELAKLVVDTRGATWKIGTPRESIVAL
jgi:UDP-N-acetyl-D-glucosamine dehydrogenase